MLHKGPGRILTPSHNVYYVNAIDLIYPNDASVNGQHGKGSEGFPGTRKGRCDAKSRLDTESRAEPGFQCEVFGQALCRFCLASSDPVGGGAMHLERSHYWVGLH